MKTKRLAAGPDAYRVLGAMVMDAVVCSRIADKWEPGGLFAGTHENRVAGWCVEHMRKYNVPIQRDMETRFREWAASRDGSADDRDVELTEKLLRHVSREYERHGEGCSSDYVLDVAGRLFTRIRVVQAIGRAEAELDANEVGKAEAGLIGMPRIELGVGSVFRPGEDYDGWVEAFDAERIKPLIRYPRELGRFLGNEFARDSFVVFMGSGKRGKSWWLLDLAYRLARVGRRIAYFEAGDLSRRQVQRRMGMRALRRPKRDEPCKVPVGYPKGDEPPMVEERQLKGVTPQECFNQWKRLQRGRDLFRLSCHPNTSLAVGAVGSVLQSWEREGWVADAVVIDYADILAPPPGVRDARDRINENWKHLRRLSQEFHCLLATATQADARSYESKLLRRSNFSDDRRKHDHVTAMLGINVTDEEKQIGVSRLNWLDRRDEEYTERRQIHVAGCLAIGCPAMVFCH